MSLSLLLDMNLSPEWVSYLQTAGIAAVHWYWSQIGDAAATDQEIMSAALTNGQIVMTQDLDFSDLLAATGAGRPSVVQIRSRNSRPHRIDPLVVSLLNQYSTELLSGALMVIDETRSRVRLLPL